MLLSRSAQLASISKRAGAGAACLAATLVVTWLLCSTETVGLPGVDLKKNTVIEPGKSFDISFECPRLDVQSKNVADVGALVLLIDADANCQLADVTLNGKRLEQRGFSR